MANSVDPDQMPHFVASDLGLYCLQRHICSNTGMARLLVYPFLDSQETAEGKYDQRILWSDSAHTQADPSLIVGFVVRWLICFISPGKGGTSNEYHNVFVET